MGQQFTHVRSLIALVLLVAAAIGSAILLAWRLDDRPLDLEGARLNEAPMHVFFPRLDSNDDIACSIIESDEWPSSWNRTPRLCSLKRGWSPAQPWGVWAMGLTSTVTIHIDAVSPRVLVMRASANPDLGPEVQQTVLLTVNGHSVGLEPLSPAWQRLSFNLPAEVLRVGSNDLAFTFKAAVSPRDAGRSADYRTMAARVSELGLLAASTGVEPGASGQLTAPAWDSERGCFRLQGSGTLTMPVDVPEGAERIRLQRRTSGSGFRPHGSIVVTVEDLQDGIGRSSQRIPIRLWPRTVRVNLEAGELAGRRALLTVEFDVPSGLACLSSPVPVANDGSPAVGPAVVPGAVQRTPHDGRPDIVLINLDAARAGNTSFSGYGRKTTPYIDALAAESLVFPNAYALAPYTLCSVPTMITGLSFLDHGVIGHEDVLSSDAVTLAESLKDLGYRTACFTATPNNSRAKGFDQGYDVFREMWTEGPRQLTIRAHFIANQVVDWLRNEAADDNRPLHLQVHMVPPHAPYDPPDAFDVFTNPEYSGPCQGNARTLNAIDGGAIPATPECLERLLGLYDGNLRTADDAFNAILNALRRRPRWRDTVVLVTSDHGEAFFEHGRMEHNSTVFTEMLHVPFVLRLPPEWDASAIDTQAMVTLADIVPTLVVAAGGSPPPSVDGVNLLDGTIARRGRHMVARTAEDRPTIGLRTLRWSLMAQPGGSGSLFDLEADPGERDNLIAQQASRYAGLAAILAERLARPPLLRAISPVADITEEERALLETLGYLR